MVIKGKIARLAKCTHKKSGKIHNELRKQFNYHSYQFINRHTFVELNHLLDTRLLSECPTSKNK